MNLKINRSTHNRDLQVYTYLINIYLLSACNVQDFLHDSDSKKFACNVRDLGSIPGLGRSPGGGNGNPLRYSCWENSQGQRRLVGYSSWGHRVGHDWTTEHTHTHTMCTFSQPPPTILYNTDERRKKEVETGLTDLWYQLKVTTEVIDT